MKSIPEIVDIIKTELKADTTEIDLNGHDVYMTALMAKARAGKDTAADYMVQKYNFKKFAFGTRLKEYAHRFYGKPEGKDRGLYQWFGQACRKVDENIWVKTAVADINRYLKETENPMNIVITDLRQPNERLFSYDNDFLTVKVECPDSIRIERMKAAGDLFSPDMLKHETERFIDVLTYDYLVTNEGTKEELHAQIDKLFNFMTGV
jgi:dephospho-CoA kinase